MAMMGEKRGTGICTYGLKGVRNSLTYVGYTVNFAKRLRQHNGELASNRARYTRRGLWDVLFVVQDLPTKKSAMQLEWRLKRARSGSLGTRPSERLLAALERVLWEERWTKKSDPAESLLRDASIRMSPFAMKIAKGGDFRVPVVPLVEGDISTPIRKTRRKARPVTK